jgi:hypothetical protein
MNTFYNIIKQTWNKPISNAVEQENITTAYLEALGILRKWQKRTGYLTTYLIKYLPLISAEPQKVTKSGQQLSRDNDVYPTEESSRDAPLSLDEISAETGHKKQRLIKLSNYNHFKDGMPLDKEVRLQNYSGSGKTVHGVILADSDIEYDAIKNIDIEKFHTVAKEILNEKENFILQCRLGGETFRDISAKLGTTRQNIQQIEERIRNKIKLRYNAIKHEEEIHR